MNPTRRRLLRLLDKTSVHIAFIALLGLLAYSNAFDVPFHFDDEDYIVRNPIIKDFNYFMDSSKTADLGSEKSNVPMTRKTRSVAFLTFLADYKIHGLEVGGYHAVNLAIHLINALLVYWGVVLTFRTPLLTPREIASPEARNGKNGEVIATSEGSQTLATKQSNYTALFAALLFVSHPVQTEAVTYLSQRFTSLVALFYLASVVFYVRWRLTKVQWNFTASFPGLTGESRDTKPDPRLRGDDGKFRRCLLYLISLLSAFLAMKTKENAATLPIAIALFEFIFFRAPLKRRAICLFPFVLAMLIVPFSLMDMDRPFGEAIGGATKTQALIPRWDYLLTQFRVVVTYLRLLVLPINQNLIYDYPVYHSFLTPDVLLSFFLLILIVSFGLYLLRKGRRLEAFGVFWFFLTLSVESSVISLEDVIFEHRLYLPSAGMFILAASGTAQLVERLKGRSRKAALAIIVLVPLALATAAYARNDVWRSETSLWGDIVKKSPERPDAHLSLGCAYAVAGRVDKAEAHYLAALRLNPNFAEAHYNIGVLYGAAGRTGQALEHYRQALRLKPDYLEAQNNLAITYIQEGRIDEGIEHFKAVLRLNPGHADAHNNLGRAYAMKGLTDEAIEHYLRALRLKPDFIKAKQNLEEIRSVNAR